MYKPKQIEKEIQIKDFISYLRKLKFNSTCPYVLQRVEEYNKYQDNVEVIILENIQPEYQTITWKDFLYALEAKGESALIIKLYENSVIIS